jgi:hypothetical protein
MKPVEEIQRVNAYLAFWQGYDPSVKTDLCSHGLRIREGWILVDPIELAEEAMADLLREAPVAGIVITSGNHERAAAVFKAKTGAPILAHADAIAEISVEIDRELSDGEEVYGLKTIRLAGFAPGEIALQSPAGSGIMMMGDALIHVPPFGFAILPEKYCEDAKLARLSLRKLLQFPSELMTFAHGLPIVTGAGRRLRELLQ